MYSDHLEAHYICEKFSTQYQNEIELQCDICSGFSKFLFTCGHCPDAKKKYRHPSCVVLVKKDRKNITRSHFQLISKDSKFYISCTKHKDLPPLEISEPEI
jgi:hypothetical protein